MSTLSNTAIRELRNSLQKSYGADFSAVLTDEEINEIGVLLLNVLAESLKMKIVNPELSTQVGK